MKVGSGKTPFGWPLATVLLFAAIVAGAGLFSLPPLDRDESRFAQATTQMLETRDFIAIRFQDRERNKKPSGAYWLQSASVSAFSDVETRQIWAYRIPSALGAVFATLFTFLAGRRLYGEQTGFLAALLIASAPVVAAEATIAKADAVLLALICLAQYAFIEIYAAHKEGRQSGWTAALTFWTAQGAAILVKGPIGPMVAAFTGLCMAVSERSIGWVFRMRLFIGLGVVLLLLAPWAFAIHSATDGRFFADAVGHDMLGKITEAQERHAGPPGYHAFLVWGLFWPAAALLGPGLAHAWRDRTDWRARILLGWIIPAWIVFEIAATKLPHYVMPLYPALAIVAAYAVVKDGREKTMLRRLGAVAYGGVGLFFAALIIAAPILLSSQPAGRVDYAVAAAFAAASLWIANVFWRGRAFRGAVCAALLAGLFAWVMMAQTLPRVEALTVSPQLSAALDEHGIHPINDRGGAVALAGYSEPSAVFLIGTDTILTNGANAGRLLAAGEVAAVAVEAREVAAFLAHAGQCIRTLAVIDGLNYSNMRPVEITIYVPANCAS